MIQPLPRRFSVEEYEHVGRSGVWPEDASLEQLLQAHLPCVVAVLEKIIRAVMANPVHSIRGWRHIAVTP